MQIRPLTQKDISPLSVLATQTYIETFGHSFSKEELSEQIAETRSEKYFLSAIDEDIFLGAFIDDKLVGYIQFGEVKFEIDTTTPDENDVGINAIYIEANYQGKGIGKKLMDTALQHERLQHAKTIFIDVWDKNKRAINFYISYGFRIVGKCPVKVGKKTVGYDLVLAQSV